MKKIIIKYTQKKVNGFVSIYGIVFLLAASVFVKICMLTTHYQMAHYNALEDMKKMQELKHVVVNYIRNNTDLISIEEDSDSAECKIIYRKGKDAIPLSYQTNHKAQPFTIRMYSNHFPNTHHLNTLKIQDDQLVAEICNQNNTRQRVAIYYYDIKLHNPVLFHPPSLSDCLSESMSIPLSSTRKIRAFYKH